MMMVCHGLLNIFVIVDSTESIDECGCGVVVVAVVVVV